MIMLRLTHLGFAAAVLAIAISPAGSARAFTFQSLDGSSTGGARFADPDGAVKNSGNGVSPFGQNGPTLELNAGSSPVGPSGRMSPLQGFSSGPRPPDPYGPHSLGNND
jgi:hypothetical protein